MGDVADREVSLAPFPQPADQQRTAAIAARASERWDLVRLFMIEEPPPMTGTRPTIIQTVVVAANGSAASHFTRTRICGAFADEAPVIPFVPRLAGLCGEAELLGNDALTAV